MDDVIFLDSPVPTSLSESAAGPEHYHIYIISGNPGLISYYTQFISDLHETLQARRNDAKFTVSGRSLRGFEVRERSDVDGQQPPYGLNQVIEHADRTLQEHVEKSSDQIGGKKPKVILVGHSVGAYISLELIRRHRARLAAGGTAAKEEARIVGGICLFPTVMHLSLSPRGTVLNALARIPPLASIVVTALAFLAFIAPHVLINLVVPIATGMPPDGTKTTVAFLKSQHGVRQALSMALDEVRQITTDEWDEEVWGAAHPSPIGQRPKLFFYFGKNDHWVADRTRDDLIVMRGRRAHGEAWKPKMEVDELGTPHAFCIGHSSPISEKVADYVDEIIKLERAYGYLECQ